MGRRAPSGHWVLAGDGHRWRSLPVVVDRMPVGEKYFGEYGYRLALHIPVASDCHPYSLPMFSLSSYGVIDDYLKFHLYNIVRNLVCKSFFVFATFFGMCFVNILEFVNFSCKFCTYSILFVQNFLFLQS